MHAALALESLEILDDHLARRAHLVARYRTLLAAVPGISPQHLAPGDESTYKDFTVVVDESAFGVDRDVLALALRAEGIDTRCYFSPPVHRHEAYRGLLAPELPAPTGWRPGSSACRSGATSTRRRSRPSPTRSPASTRTPTPSDSCRGRHEGARHGRRRFHRVAPRRRARRRRRPRRRARRPLDRIRARTWRPTPTSSKATSPTPRRSPTSSRGCDVVFHLAARGSVQRSVEQPLATDKTNVSGTLTVLCAAHDAGVGRVVLSSSSSVYGGAGQRPTARRPAVAATVAVCREQARRRALREGLRRTARLRDGDAPVLQRVRPTPARRQPVRRRGPPLHRRVAPRRSRRDPRRRPAEPRLHVRHRRRPGQPARRGGTRRRRASGAPTTSPGASPTPCSSSSRRSPTCWASTPSPSTSRAGPATSAIRRPRSRPPATTSASAPSGSLRDGLADDRGLVEPRPCRQGRPRRRRDRARRRPPGPPRSATGDASPCSGRATSDCPLRCVRARSGSPSSGSTPMPNGWQRSAAGTSYVTDVADDELAGALEQGYRPTDDPADLEAFDVAVITVPTPLREGMPDLSHVEQAAGLVADALRPGALVVLESTTYPGTTNELVRPILERSGLGRRPRLLPRLLARADRPGQPELGPGQHAQGRVGRRRAIAALRRGVLRGARRQGGARRFPRRGRAGQAPREHVPPRQHRARQRAGDVRLGAGHRHLERDRRRVHQAVRVPPLHARSRRRRTLPADRPVVPVVAGEAHASVARSGSSNWRTTSTSTCPTTS